MEGKSSRQVTDRSRGLRELARSAIGEQEGAVLATEELAPGSIVFPRTADGESPNAQVPARLWKLHFTQHSSLEGIILTSLPNALAQLTKEGSHLIDACGADVATLVQMVGPGVFNPFANVSRVRAWFGGVKHFPQIDMPCRIIDHGTPVDVSPIDRDPAELKFGNHQSAKDHDEFIWEKVAADVAAGRAIIFEVSRAEGIKRLRISPLGIVQESKLRIIHDMSFSPARNRMSVNHLTDFEQAPCMGLGHVLPDVLNRIMYLRQRLGPLVHIVMSKVDVKNAFRQIRVDPTGTPAFGYRLDNTVDVDLRPQFGWRSSPGF